MWPWLKAIWTDPAQFRATLRMLVFIGGELVRNGTIPTGQPGLGALIGPFIQAAALFIAAGQQNDDKPKE